MQGDMQLCIWDVEHGACAMIQHVNAGVAGPLAMIDSGCTDDWRPSTHITRTLRRTRLDYLFITNADQDHMSDLAGFGMPAFTLPVRTGTRATQAGSTGK